MSWEARRNGRRYYYRTQRIGKRIIKTYCGSGATGSEAQEMDIAARQTMIMEAQEERELFLAFRTADAALAGLMRIISVTSNSGRKEA